ncbi:restriction endonuclease subunit S [Thiothrix subterranea]|uniref:restriction endonuclease subunit S n=1 Tax=Thiothrix subterranea TaxID=2735563 RepID=UPI00192C2ADF|nr:restriction endonuclease subunit S [Thiothrix subterranea]QQZ28783.1 restriction endonuclease subunit S [Thiothrix subterranea]
MDYPAYPVYRESGIEWLGKIPDHWEVRRLKFVAEIQNGRDYKEVESSEGYPVFGSGGVFRFATEYLYDGESVLFGRKGTIDKPLYVNEKFWTVDTMFYSVILEQTHGRFLYFFATTLQFNLLATQTALPSITQTDLGNYLISYPTYQEQQTIAQFLDYKTQQIDQLIAKKRTLIDRLNEQRIALITHAVTKGLNPAVTLKDSGVEWLGKVPKHWQQRRLKFVVQNITDTEHKTAEYFEDGEYLVVRTTNVRNGKLILDKAKYTNQDTYEEWTRRAKPKAGDILFTREAPAGETCIVPDDIKLCIGQRMVLFQFDKTSMNPIFLLNSLHAGLADEFIKKLSLGSTVAHFNMSDIQNIPVFVPNIKEQNDIAVYLDKETARIDRMVELNKQTIDKLKEYRTALITAAVTGKIDLRNWQQEANHANP